MCIIQAVYLASDKQCFFTCPKQIVLHNKPPGIGIGTAKLLHQKAVLEILVRNLRIGPGIKIFLIIHITVF